MGTWRELIEAEIAENVLASIVKVNIDDEDLERYVKTEFEQPTFLQTTQVAETLKNFATFGNAHGCDLMWDVVSTENVCKTIIFKFNSIITKQNYKFLQELTF